MRIAMMSPGCTLSDLVKKCQEEAVVDVPTKGKRKANILWKKTLEAGQRGGCSVSGTMGDEGAKS